MIKKITFVILVCCILVSCGKKGDPEYKVLNKGIKIPTIIIFVSYWIIGFPLCYFLGRESIYSSVGIWVGLLVGLTLSSIFLFIRFDYLSKKMISKK